MPGVLAPQLGQWRLEAQQYPSLPRIMSCFEPRWPNTRPSSPRPRHTVRATPRLGIAPLLMSDDRSSPGLGEGEQESRDCDVRLTLPARPENVAVVRHVLGAFAEALRLPDGLVEDLRLAVTEACTNVVRHAYTPGAPGPVEISIRPEDDVVSVVVA